MTLKRNDLPHIDKYTLELVSQGRGGLYKAQNEIIMSVANSSKKLPCGCSGTNYYVVKREGTDILEEISESVYRSKQFEEVVHLEMPFSERIKISIS